MNRHAAILLVVLGMPVFGADAPSVEETRRNFEKLAAQLPYLAIDSVLYDRPRHLFQSADPKDHEEHSRILAEVTDRRYAKETLVKLLKDGDPKIRTLAAVALFDWEDPSVLPELSALCADEAPTFDGHGKLSELWLASTGIGPPKRDQTVGGFARSMVSMYLQEAGIHWGLPETIPTVFATYWEARKERPHCASWFSLQLARANSGRYEGVYYGEKRGAPEAVKRIRALRQRIEELPGDERAWVLLRLQGEDGGDILVTEQEVVEACKGLGPEKLRLMLQNRIPSGDPDLQPGLNSDWDYRRMGLFILSHGEQLFGTDDSGAMLTMEQQHRDLLKSQVAGANITAQWAIAAARLKPERASKILRAAMDRFSEAYQSDERAELCVALWQLAGKREVEYVLNRFYEERPKFGSFADRRNSFIEGVGKGPNGKDIIIRLIKDQRFDRLDWGSLVELVRVVNAWSETPILTEKEIRETWHPLGLGNFREAESAEAKYPKETVELHKRLGEWRERLRASTSVLMKGAQAPRAPEKRDAAN